MLSGTYSMRDDDKPRVMLVSGASTGIPDFVTVELGSLAIIVHNADQARRLAAATQEALSLCTLCTGDRITPEADLAQAGQHDEGQVM